MLGYMECLKRCNNDNSLCRKESRQYLQCRMDRCTVLHILDVLARKEKGDTKKVCVCEIVG